MRNEKRKSKKKVHLEGFTSFARPHGQKATAVNKHTSKSVIFRPAATAIACSDLSEGITSPNNLLLNEAKATIQLGKSLGINFNGKEDDYPLLLPGEKEFVYESCSHLSSSSGSIEGSFTFVSGSPLVPSGWFEIWILVLVTPIGFEISRVDA
ncbi:hypothetical protein TEA_012243 [Camellia sinensis var. sinensis]|uniref:ApaG domain-containing protein n=1 Tax=Camellia sinensis var. sinensis TaxID=542762 RepID=A0A4S4DHL4_CAMSN|nr:hypothetical protein TEA_012243 [Camellia sinensis var. sinensis]